MPRSDPDRLISDEPATWANEWVIESAGCAASNKSARRFVASPLGIPSPGHPARPQRSRNSAERGGQRRTHCRLDQRNIGGREDEQGATHRHPPHQNFPVVHRRGDFVERGLGTSGEDNRYAVAGSVACRAIREATTSSGPAASPRRSWRLTIKVRRSWVEIVRTLPTSWLAISMPACLCGGRSRRRTGRKDQVRLSTPANCSLHITLNVDCRAGCPWRGVAD